MVSYLMETCTTSDTLLATWYRTPKLSSGGLLGRILRETDKRAAVCCSNLFGEPVRVQPGSEYRPRPRLRGPSVTQTVCVARMATLPLFFAALNFVDVQFTT